MRPCAFDESSLSIGRVKMDEWSNALLGFIWGFIAGYSSFLHQVQLASHKLSLDMTEKVTIIKIPTKLWLVILNFVYHISLANFAYVWLQCS